MKIINIKPEEFQQFAINHPLKNFYQTSSYGNTMNHFGFQSHYIGIIHKGELIGVSLVLSIPIYMGLKYGYAPHGLLIDYSNTTLLRDIIKKLKSFLFKSGFLMLKIDPLIIRSIRDEKGEIVEKNENFDQVMTSLKKCGLIHCGFNNYLESVKPRWHAIINLKDKKATQLFYELEKQIRNKLRKAVKYGIEIYKDSTNNLENVYPFIKDKGNYSLKYYQTLKKEFGNNFELYYSKLNTQVYVENSKNLFEKETETNDYLNEIIQNEGYRGKDMRAILNKKMESDRILSSYKNHLVRSTQLLKKYPDGIIIGGMITIHNEKKINLLIDGYSKEYNDLCPGYLAKWKVLEKYAETEVETFDLNAISGNFTDKNLYKGLNEAKLGYNSLAYEYIGEFNLIINKPMYSLYRSTSDKFSLKKKRK